MKFCQKCGYQLADEAAVCPSCGNPAPINTAAPQYTQQPQYAQQPQYTQQAPAYNPAQYSQPQQAPYYQPPVEENATLSVLAMVFAFLASGVGLVLSIIGMNTYKTPALRKRCKTALILSIIFLAISVVIGAIYGAIVGAAIESATGGYYY